MIWKVLLAIVALWVVISVAGALLGAVLEGVFWLVAIGALAGGGYLLVKALSKDRDTTSLH
ncbi:hypothetical protein DW322_12530 [Rhodococcus rhodnii]|uniref:Uncharacterized protein n=2 Tax=Rhodococcus rhodnii TaxID=38312 RepID=R7WP89_9NOCA|nr:hypothetical protein [Rhodococcus rhodnii]EOM77095.1 hypothetical protein Rrhod_1562 [Rhodococcus rhodnii LMG 5362]TXG90900.1 hypothetical protein DW322_12530 [Rhodococcus rhodnii]